MKISGFVFLLLIPLFLTHCKIKEKNNDEEVPSPMPPYVPPGQLPPETQEGWNFFGCKVNGEVWVPQVSPYSSQPPIHADYENGIFFVTGRRKTSVLNEFITIEMMPLASTGNYAINGSNGVSLRAKINDCLSISDSLDTGQLEIINLAYDPNRGGYIISGRFHFTLITPNCDTLRVTDGRFDIFD